MKNERILLGVTILLQILRFNVHYHSKVWGQSDIIFFALNMHSIN